MTTLELRFLGGLSIYQDGRPLASLKSQKGQALLCYLALTGKAHTRSALAGLLWPEMPEENALMSLRTVLNKVNHHLATHLAVTRQSIAFNQAASSWIDVTEFEAGVTAKSDIGRLQVAVALYQGDFLDGFYLDDAPHFDGWVLGQQARLRQAALDGLHHLVTHLADQSDHETAIAYARQLLGIEPWREEAHRDLMRLLALSGQRSAALTQYETCRDILAAELDVEPAPATVSLYEQIKANGLVLAATSGVAQVSVLRLPQDDRVIIEQPAALPLHNLPVQTTPFIGREAELAALGQYLADPTTRLITILGPGGMGKTRLALACAERHVRVEDGSSDLFARGVFFVNLAPLSDVDHIVPTLAQSLQFPLQSNDPRSPRQQVLDYLSQKRMLLVLDNFEHLLAGVELLVEMAQAAPHVRLLATSRERLHLQLEQVFPLQGLPFPEVETAAAPEITEDALGYTAVQLFLQSARRNRPDFALQSAADVADVARICRLTAGMPLALELTAAWVDTLSLADIAAEMQQSLDFLETERHDLPARHRSVRAAIEPSWAKLTEREQATLAQLSVFRGGFTREAVQAVTGATLPLLSRLVSKSFLQLDWEHGRYQIHELLRQFAAEKLAQTPEVETAVCDRHSATYCTFLYERTEQWHTARQLETLSAVTREADNVQVAWRWALAQGEWQRLGQAIDSWGSFHDWQGRYADGESFCQAIVEKAGRQSRETAVSSDCLRLWVRALAWLSWFTADLNVAVGVLPQSLALLERPELVGQDTRQEKAFVLHLEGGGLPNQDPQEARQFIEQSLALYQELGNQWGIAEGLRALGYVNWRTGNHDWGLDRVQAALAIHLKRGDRREQANCMTLLGRIHKTLGRLEEAERLEREALRLSQQIGDRSQLVTRHANLAHTLLWQGKFAEAHLLAEESLAICRELGHRATEGWVQYCLSEILLHRGQYQPAGRQATGGMLVVKATGDRRHEGALYGVLGQLALVESSYVKAQEVFTKSAKLFRETRYSLIDLSAAGLGYAADRLGQPQKARQYLDEALVSALVAKTYMSVVFALPGVALLLAGTGEADRAVETWALARCHPFVANSKWFEDVAGRELEALAATLPPEVAEAARERGQKLELWPTVGALLAELELTKMAER